MTKKSKSKKNQRKTKIQKLRNLSTYYLKIKKDKTK